MNVVIAKKMCLWLLWLGMLLAVPAGCAWMSGNDAQGRPFAKKFEVDVSGLDWVELSYMPAQDDAVFKMACQLSLLGSGEVAFRTGRSPLVWDAFSSKIEDPHWNELHTDRINLPPEEMEAVYQDLVDAGLFPLFEGRGSEKEIKAPFVKVNAKIGHARAIRILDDPRIVGIVEKLLRPFEDLGIRAQEGQPTR